MKHVRGFAWCVACAGVCALSVMRAAQGDIIFIGDTDPDDPDRVNGDVDLFVGVTGAGEAFVDGASDLVSRKGYLGYAMSGIGAATITGPGTTWTAVSDMYVGYLGDGELDITGGASVQSPSGAIAYEAGSAGAATISGAGSLLAISGALTVGREGRGCAAYRRRRARHQWRGLRRLFSEW